MKCKCHSYNADKGTEKEAILNVSEFYKKYPDKKKTICVDACIAEQIKMLWMHNIWTLGCCCGHNKLFGEIHPNVIIAQDEDPYKTIRLLEQYDPDRKWVVKQWCLISYL